MLRENTILVGSYDYRLVVLSVLIATCASYTALDLAGRVTVARGTARSVWLTGGAIAMGLGIWSMHYIGMLAFRLSIPIRYDWPIVLISLLASIFASAAALYVASGQGMSLWRTTAGSTAMGGGIGAMHYIGMYAMRMSVMCHFDPAVVVLSIILAVAISFAALRLVFFAKDHSESKRLRKVASAIAMGAAIPILHYTGMAAATFTASSEAPDLSHSVGVSTLGMVGLVVATIMVLGIAILTSTHDRLVRAPRTMRTRVLSVRIRALRTAMLTFCIMVVFEAAKQALHPKITIWTSHGVTILFATLVAAVLAFAVLKREERLHSDLAANEKRYRLLFERSLAGVFRSTLDGHILDCNAAFCRILGYTAPEELQARSVRDVYISLTDRVRFIGRLQAENSLTNFENCLRRKDGSVVWVLENATLAASEDGSDPVIEGTLTDVTERRRAEENLRRLAAIVRCSDDAIISLTTGGTIQTWNAGAEQIYGYSAEEALGAPINILAPTGRANEVQEILEKVKSGKEIEHFAATHVRKGGQQIDIALTVSPITDTAGEVVGASAIARDITTEKRAEEALRESEMQYRLLFDTNPIPMWVFDRKTLGLLAVNEAAIRHYGFSKREFLAMTIADIRPEEDIPALLEATPQRIAGLQKAETWRHRKRDGTIIRVEIVSHDLDFHGIAAELVAAHDITERKRAEEALQQAEEKYRAIFEDAVVGIFQTTPDGHYTTVNPAMARMLGYDSPQELLASITNISQQVYVDPKRREEFRRLLRDQGTVRDFECQVYRKDRSKMWVSANARAVCKAGVLVGYEGMNEDITAHKVAEERVQFLAYYDALTALPNRPLLQDRLTKALATSRRQKDKVALLFLDLDRFKIVNDSLGHSVGDLLLQEVAERLRKLAREQDTVARVGGDEFLIVLTSIKDVADAAVAAERIVHAMTEEFVVQGHSLSMSCSLGISIFPEHGVDGETLLKNADEAMYCAKENGRNNFRFFTEDMNIQAVERLTLENSLRSALDRKEFFLMYQPQMDIASGMVTGLEALLRWRHPKLGLVPPDKFIRIAENCGLILPIGEWVLRTACAQARKWQDEGLPAVPVAVNTSAVQFRQESFCELIRSVLHETGLAPRYLDLELTESLLLSNADVTLSVLRKLKAMGLTLSIDDFGTGYSSLSYLKQFPVSKLKIDRSFVREAAVNSDDAAIATAIISMAKSLNLKVIAEGVENDAQMSFLRAHHCDEIQGYYFSKPLSAEDVVDKLGGPGRQDLIAKQVAR